MQNSRTSAFPRCLDRLPCWRQNAVVLWSGVHGSVVSRTLRLPCLVVVLSLACGRTHLGTPGVLDGGPDQGRDQARDHTHEDASPGTDAIDGEPGCGSMERTFEWPVVELVVDRSASLAAPAAGGQSAWQITREALARVISRLTPASPAIGLTLFPNHGDCTEAPVAVPAAPITEETKAALLAALAAVQPGGARSPASALALAQADATKVFANGLKLSSLKTLILLVGGAPDPSAVCGDSTDPVAALQSQLATAYEKSAITWVLALPGAASARGLLEQIARRGCLPITESYPEDLPVCFRDCDQGEGSGTMLEEGIECILRGGGFYENACVTDNNRERGYRSCFFSILDTAADVDWDATTVTMTIGTAAPRVVPRADCDLTADGWEYTDGGKAIHYCSRTCAEVAGAWHERVTLFCK